MVNRITISKDYPSYWEYNGQPTMLLGGSVEDNLFQIPDLEEHLTLLSAVGGNYVRCTMSSRDPGDVWPFERTGGLYDLHKPSQEYWDRFRRFLDLTLERDIIVQIEVWDRFDFAREPWQENPFNPRLNSNYSAAESGLQEDIDTHPGGNENRFFFSVPALDNNDLLLNYQQAHVDKLLSISRKYPHILYCMDNETSGEETWGQYWGRHIKQQAAEQGVEVHVTEMWDAHDLGDPMHRRTFDHPELYSFCDVSQNNHQTGQRHWDNAQQVRQYIADRQVRPLNNVKIYGCDQYRFGTDQDGMERFWRNVFGKMASARFHRPSAGLGLGELAQANLKSMRMVLQRIDVFRSELHNVLLSEREDNEAYCIGIPGQVLAVFFPLRGEVELDCAAYSENIVVEWLDVLAASWLSRETIANPGALRLCTPSERLQVAVVTSAK